MAGIREEVAASDFARLMPADALFYLEVAEPGQHVARVAQMVNLVAPPEASSARMGIPLGEGFVLPDPVQISPALFNELKELRGAAVALTEVEKN